MTIQHFGRVPDGSRIVLQFLKNIHSLLIYVGNQRLCMLDKCKIKKNNLTLIATYYQASGKLLKLQKYNGYNFALFPQLTTIYISVYAFNKKNTYCQSWGNRFANYTYLQGNGH